MKALNNILSGHSADELDKLFVSDPHYAEFLKYVNWRRNCEMGRTTCGFIDYNLGTLFEYASQYSVCEQFFAIGFTHKQIAEDFRYSINEVPKWLRNYCIGVKMNRLLNNKFVDFYKKYPDYVQTILQTQYMTVTQSDLMFFFANRSTDYYMEILTSLNKDYGYNLADVFVYMDKIMTFEAIVAINWLLRELRDYARMMDAISHKFDRYPRHFKTTMDIVTRNYKRLQKEFSEEKLQNLFETGTYNNSRSSDSRKGMGIGLSICKTIITAHHGTLNGRNHADGAEFCFTLPKSVDVASEK